MVLVLNVIIIFFCCYCFYKIDIIDFLVYIFCKKDIKVNSFFVIKCFYFKRLNGKMVK